MSSSQFSQPAADDVPAVATEQSEPLTPATATLVSLAATLAIRDGNAGAIRSQLGSDASILAQFDLAVAVQTAMDGPGEGGAEFASQSLADVAAEVKAAGPPRWLFRPVVVSGDYGIISAEKKAGKTWAILDAAVSCASGGSWLGEYPTSNGGPVIIFYGEGGRRKMVRRVRAIGIAKGLSRDEIDSLPIYFEFNAPKLGNLGDLELIRQAIARRRPALVIIDPLYLSAGGAKGNDLYSMGALLNGVQKIAQDAGTTLLISHHWNKGGTGDGHDRSSGVGPAEWGRFLISVAVKSRRTNQVTKETTVVLKWSFAGDEIPDEEVTFVRRVRVDNPDDLSSEMHYAIVADDTPQQDSTEDGPHFSPAEAKIIEAMVSDQALTIQEITNRVAERHGHGLKRPTVSSALNRLAGIGVVDQVGTLARSNTWILVNAQVSDQAS